jgi:hypothetical protein
MIQMLPVMPWCRGSTRRRSLWTTSAKGLHALPTAAARAAQGEQAARRTAEALLAQEHAERRAEAAQKAALIALQARDFTGYLVTHLGFQPGMMML